MASQNTETIESVLNHCLDPVLSSRRTTETITRGVLALSAEQQDFVLHWVEIVSKYNAEMAYQFASKAPLAITLTDVEGTRKWLLNAMDVYDKQGLYPGSAALNDVENFAQQFRLEHITVTLNQVKRVLETMLHGLSGRHLKIESGNSTFTDTETIYLPAAINRFNDAEKNYQLYKIMAIHLWAQTWFGTFKRPSIDSPHLTEYLEQFDDSARATQLFNLLETFRLNACIQRYLPGLATEIDELDETKQIDNTWQTCIGKLQSDTASVMDTLQITQKLYDLQIPWPTPFIYQGKLSLDQAQVSIDKRNEKNKKEIQTSIDELMQQLMQQGDNSAANEMNADSIDISVQKDGNDQISLAINGQSAPISDEMLSTLESTLQDLEEISTDWLTPSHENGQYNDRAKELSKKENSKNPKTDKDIFLYDEWDYRRQTYRKNWCTLRESIPHPANDDFVEKTLSLYKNLVSDIRRHFEALLGEDTNLKAQYTGDEIDLDAVINARADILNGCEMNERIYVQRRKTKRDLAVIIMVDVSGSTKGWINQAERESLVLLCQALEILGDQYAIYGFSGMTRNRCEIYTIKTFDMPYNEQVRARISGLRPQDYTRMGVAIRHLNALLRNVEARTRVLITLSDGKPDDYDGYKGDYGIEDTRQALLEGRHSGIHSFCITIDKEAESYLSHMYGQANYAVVNDIKKLPIKIADIYRNFTT